METAFPFNMKMFDLFNATATPNAATVLIAKGLAVFAPWLVIGILVLVWFLGTVDARRSLMIAGVALGLVGNFSIAFLTYVPRPSERGLGNTLLSHGHETSFPSDHATFMWSLGFGLIMTRPLLRLGAFIIGLGLATAWARVYLGVHFPLDMAASLTISVLAASLAKIFAGKLEGLLIQPVERVNAGLMRRFKADEK